MRSDLAASTRSAREMLVDERDEDSAADEQSPPSPESSEGVVEAPRAPVARTRDTGRTVAIGTMAALVLLGGVLILRGPQTAIASAPPAAMLTGADVSTPADGDLSATAVALVKAAVPAAPAPKFVPVWRVSSLKLDASVEVLEGTLGRRTLGGAFQHAGLSRLEARRLARSFDGVRRIEHGSSKDTFTIARDRSKGTVVGFEYVASPTDIWQAKPDEGSGRLVLKKLELFVERKPAPAALLVSADLAKAVAAAKLREEALGNIDDALEGHVELSSIKPGVRMRVVGSEEWVEGTFARFHVDALEYVPKDGSSLRIYYYERAAAAEATRRASPLGWYDAKGQRQFRGTFRSPLPLARVTSRFNPKRMHPVLHVVMPHNGVDFGAAAGTPVYASAQGTLQSAGDGGPCGNMVKISHASGLTTAYCHLSRFAPGLHAGQHVEERQLVGYVGQTGRATGPHLHFAVLRGTTFIDPLGIKMDGVRTLPSADRDAFAKRRTELDAALDAIAMPAADGAPVPADDDKDEPAGEE